MTIEVLPKLMYNLTLCLRCKTAPLSTVLNKDANLYLCMTVN